MKISILKNIYQKHVAITAAKTTATADVITAMPSYTILKTRILQNFNMFKLRLGALNNVREMVLLIRLYSYLPKHLRPDTWNPRLQ